jgi:lantibiotic modifying enzyme
LKNGEDVSFCNGLSGIAWTLDYFSKIDLIETDLDFLQEIDDHIELELNRIIEIEDWDFLHGFIGIGFYFLERKNHIIVNKIVKKIEEISIKDSNGIKWLGFNYAPNKEIVYCYPLSLSHGSSSIIAFLNLCIKENKMYSKKARTLLDKAVIFLKSCELKDKKSLFPPEIPFSNEIELRESKLAWCNGDLGIGYTFLKIGEDLENDQLYQKGLDICLHSAMRKNQDISFIKDSCLCHGTAGVSYIFKKLFYKTNNPVFDDASSYWLDETLKMALNNTADLDMLFWGGEELGMKKDYSLLGGIIGVGLVLISLLNGKSANWDKILLL